VTVPPTPVKLYAEVWNGAYSQAGTEYRQLYLDATVSAQVGPASGQNVVDWQFATPTTQVQFGDDTVVTVSYQAVRMPDGVPQIQFQDGSPMIGFPGPTYYPTLVEADVEVSRPLINPIPGGPGGSPGGDTTTPEPSGALLLAGLALGGWFTRRAARLRQSATRSPRCPASTRMAGRARRPRAGSRR
jgi:hypothetical protein